VSPEAGGGVAVASTVRWPVSARQVRRVARSVLGAERARGAVLTVAFVGARRIRSLNRAYLGKDRATDVIAFWYDGGQAGGRTEGRSSPDRIGPSVRRSVRASVVGDIYICPDVARRNARVHGVPVRDEIARLVIHGVLHVLGYDHPEGPDRAASPMWRRQERYLARFARGR